MIRWFKQLAAVASLALLASCGGGGSAGSCTFDCPPPGEVEVADLLIELDSLSIGNSGTQKVTATVTALDSKRVSVAAAPVEVSVDSNAIVTVGASETDSSGTVTATVGIGADKSNRTVTITAVSGDVTSQATFQVTGTRITSTYASTVTPNSAGNVIHYLVTDINATPLANQEITVSGTGLPSVTGTTSDTGSFDYTYTAPGTAGTLTITANAAGVSDVATVQVQATGGVDDAVGPVSSASVSASPNKVSTNTEGSTANQSQIRALFVRPDNSAVQNVRVRFDMDDDVNSVGGTLSSGNAMLYSSALGTVTVSYIPGTRSSPTDGVTIRACWDYTDFAAGTCPNAVRTKLTVTAEAISVTLGTNGLIEEGDAKLTYIKKFVVMVVDSAGNAMPGVTISPVVDLVAYAKGDYIKGAGAWQWEPTIGCPNEDLNRNGVLDSGEDVNHNGKLEPRKADVSIRMVDSNTTDESGMAVLQIEYPQNVAGWDYATITVSASGVSGTEGSATYSSWLWVLADHANDLGSTPAFRDSPYGFVGSCTDPN